MLVTIATEPAQTEQPNDDYVAALPYAVVVLDGAGNVDGESGCRHGTAWYVRHLGGALVARLCDEPTVNLSVALAEAIRDVRDLHADGENLNIAEGMGLVGRSFDHASASQRRRIRRRASSKARTIPHRWRSHRLRRRRNYTRRPGRR